MAWRGRELAGVFPLWRRDRRLEGLADALHTPVFRVPALDAAALTTVTAAALDATGEGELAVEALADGDPELPALRSAAGARRRLVVVEPQHVSPIVDTAGDFDDYRRAAGRRWRELERRRRKRHREHAVRYELIRSPEDLDHEPGADSRSRRAAGRVPAARRSSPHPTPTPSTAPSPSASTRPALELSELWLGRTRVAFDLSLCTAAGCTCSRPATTRPVRLLPASCSGAR